MNIDVTERAKFDALAQDWWNPHGRLWTLHAIQPLRLQFIEQHTTLSQQHILDVGCGGGLLSEALAQRGAKVIGLDVSIETLHVAREHAKTSHLSIDYQEKFVEDFAKECTTTFDIITNMELLEHVPDPATNIAACAQRLKPDGKLFVSTINRNMKAYLTTVIGAEYILGWLPKGTHDYARFIRPSELCAMAEAAELKLIALQGISYQWTTKKFVLSNDVGVNYLAAFSK